MSSPKTGTENIKVHHPSDPKIHAGVVGPCGPGGTPTSSPSTSAPPKGSGPQSTEYEK